MSILNITELEVTRHMRNNRENAGVSTPVSTGGGSSSGINIYSHTGTTARTVGGISSGSDLNGLTYQQLFDMLFY